MSFWQNLANSYDKNADVLKITYPLSTTSISNNSDIIAIIVIDGDGNFVRSDKIEKKSKATKKSPGNPLVNITIPVTERSLGRSSTGAWKYPNPVFEQYGYLKSICGKPADYINKFYDHCNHVRKYVEKLKVNEEKFKSRYKRWNEYGKKIKKLEGCGKEDCAKKYSAYIAQLKDFAESDFATKQIKAIYQYVTKQTIAFNLLEMKLDDKTYIVFQVEIPGNPQTQVWNEEFFFNAWYQYYLSEKKKRHGERIEAENKLANPRDLS